MADVVLPGACWAEVDGTFSNTERRVQRVRKAVEPPGDALPNWKIFSEIGTRLGIAMKYDSAEEIFNEMSALTPSFGGLTYDRIDVEGIQWPCPSKEHPGTRFLHQGAFTRGKGKFHAIDHQKSKDEADKEFPFTLTTGRRYAHYNTSTMTGRCKTLVNEFPEPIAQINTVDAGQMGLKDGDQVRVISRRGEVITPIRVGNVVPPGSLFMDFHFASANSNVLLGTFLDPVSKTPDYKVCAVKLEKCAD
jgi:formate dehydrogenase alpha subunit